MIDFAAFLRTRFKPEDWVVAKIDVEGSEYDLFDHLLATGAASLLDEIFVEVRNCRTTRARARARASGFRLCLPMPPSLPRLVSAAASSLVSSVPRSRAQLRCWQWHGWRHEKTAARMEALQKR